MTDPIAICNCIQCPILTQYQTTQMISLDYASTFELGPFSANILSTVAAHLANFNEEQPESESSSDDSSDTSSDSDELQTLSDDSDDETNSNIQKINLLFSGLEDVNYDTPDEDKM